MMQSKAHVLVVDDDPGIRRQIGDRLASRGHRVDEAANGAVALEMFRRESPDLAILDLHLPDTNGLEVLSTIRKEDDGADVAALVITAYGDIETAVEAMKLGAFDFITKPFDMSHLDVCVDKALGQVDLKRENRWLRSEISKRLPPIVVESRSMDRVMTVVGKVADTMTTILLLGESGTGKEVIARQIHARSRVSRRPFVACNCAALPAELMESELFGHEQGAFTGAARARKGLFEVANGGTLFLDEIGEMPLELQPKLLRVLQDQTFTRVGATKETQVNVRVVAATNKDLERAVDCGEFRKDLYYRLNVVSIEIPPLRDRPDDVEPLTRTFLQRYSRETHRRVRDISDDALGYLKRYAWPGNVRELQNAIERAVVLSDGDILLADDLPTTVVTGEGAPGGVGLAAQAQSASADRFVDLGFHEAVKEFKRRLIRAALDRHDGLQVGAAKSLDLHPTYLSRLIKNLEVRAEA